MTAALLLALAVLLPSAPRQEEEGPSPEQVQAAVEALEGAYKEGDAAAQVAAIRSAMEVVDKKVIDLVAKGLEKEREVAFAACDALGRMPHPESIKKLNSFYAKEKRKLGKAEAEDGLVAVLKSVGRLGDPKGIDILVDSPFKSKGYPVLQARFFGLANIRDAKAVEALFGLLDKVGNVQLDRYMSDIRLALVQLTGTDRGDDPRQWQAWWRENKRGYEVPAEAKELPIEMRLRWNEYWGIKEKPEKGQDG
jgi:HEAT repeat protein